ncbi:hypothetical protein NQ315_014204 [Exocentrus adspersus]|uniref:non-specific serine/threonine protein kinase n=1 Tax=Exocentrus adspersus TaxID=1586481 RepID=A0AAV8VB56_9CUCU|nr:hypothetical protein NQ315_014204 [Exocentrus adspersus]
MTSLTELGLMSKPTICELVTECSYFMVHPNLWIRQAVAGFISISAKALSLLDLFRRLEATGMNETVEEYLLRMEHHLKKIHKHKMNADARHNKQKEGKIELNSPSNLAKSHVFNLGDNLKGDFMSNRVLHRTNTYGSIETNVNSEWNYSSEVLTRQSESTNSGGPSSRSTSSRPSSPPAEGHNQFVSGDPSSNISLHERSYIQYRRSNCYIELANLKNKQQEHYFEALRSKEWEDQATWRPQLPVPGWRLKGRLVAHLHEHRGAINKLCALPDTPLFASCSADGSVRLWDCAKLEGRTIANRSKQQYKMASGSCINSMSVCEGGQSLATVCQDGTINILRVDSASNKMNLVQSRQLNADEDGFAVDVNCLDSGSQSVVVYATLYGCLVGWDLRAPGIAWRLENGLKRGLITTFCMDPHHSWLTLGTSSGYHTTWDLRFQLPITTIEHPSAGARIRKVVSHPTEHSWVLSSVQGNNEISIWNIETGFRQSVLWGSTAPPLSKTGSTNSVCAMLSGYNDNVPFVLAGGTDQRLRFWNLENPAGSYLAIPAASDPSGIKLMYHNRLIDGTQVAYEELGETKQKDECRTGPEPPPAGHKDCISDVVLCKASKCFLITSSRDGVIKIWR